MAEGVRDNVRALPRANGQTEANKFTSHRSDGSNACENTDEESSKKHIAREEVEVPRTVGLLSGTSFIVGTIIGKFPHLKSVKC